MLDAVVVGAGPNGLAAAITLAHAGRRVRVIEAESTIGGGCRSAPLTIPGYVHDICSAVHPMAAVSPFFRTLPLAEHGLEWIEPPVMLAHPFDDQRAAVIYRSLEETAAGLDTDARPYSKLIGTVVKAWDQLEDAVLGPPRWPRHPVALARFGLKALQSVEQLARRHLSTPRAQALLSGIGAHTMLPLDRTPTGAVALVLASVAHTAGWIFPRGGAQRLADALASYLRTLGGEIVTGTRVASIDELPAARTILCDLSPRPLLRIAGHLLPLSYRRQLERYRYGMGVYKVDWALDGPIPWRDDACRRAGTVHLGGTLGDIAGAERRAWKGFVVAHPFVILAQPSLFDDSRAPHGGHTVWGYCHVPHGSTSDMLAQIESQIERFAPGFGDRIRGRHIMTPSDLERHNPNFVGGDIAAGVTNMRQLLARPTWRTYSTPRRGLYLCSASTPPGVGVHGMCGYFAAQRALADVLR
jgi:phytoene dehydrogenase-like protein